MAARINLIVEADDRTSGALGKVKSALGGIFQTAAGFLSAQIFQRLGQEVVDFAKDSIGAASDLNETISKTNQIFGEELGASLVAWAENAATAIGQSQQAALDAAANFGTFGKAAGLAGKDLESFVKDNAVLTADLASFWNASTDEVATAISAAFRGESEPIRRFGVLLDDTSLRQKALELGIVSTTKDALTPQQRVLAANALLWDQTADAQGDFARTSDGLANQQRIFNAQLDNTKASLGQIFLPLITQAMQVLNTQAIPALMSFIGTLRTFEPPELLVTFLSFLRSWWELNGPFITSQAKIIFDALKQAFTGIGEDAGGLLSESLAKFAMWFTENGPLIKDFAKFVADAFVNVIIPAVVTVWETIKPLLTGIFDLVLGLAKLVMQVATGDWAGAWGTIESIVATAGKAIGDAVMALLDGIAGMFGTSLDEIGKTWSESWELLKQIASKIFDNIVEAIDRGIGTVATTFDNVITAIQKAIDWVKKFASTIADVILPDWLTPGSPTPFEIGLLGINDALKRVNMTMPTFGGNFGSLASPSPVLAAAPVSAGGGIGGATVNLQLVYSPMVSTADESELQTRLAPLIENLFRKAQADLRL